MQWWAALPGRVLGPMFTLDAVRVGRRLSTFLVRFGYLLLLTFILFMFFSSWSYRLDSPNGIASPSELARFAEDFFWVYAVTQFLVVVALTPSFTAAAITDEKERKTLDFLLVTDLSTREIVFGKLAVRAGALFTLVLAGLPILSLVQFFGGIDPELLLIAVGMTLVTLISLSAIGIACSVMFARTRDSVVLAYVLPLAYVILSSFATVQAGFDTFYKRDWSITIAGRTITEMDAASAFASGNPFWMGNRTSSIGLTGADRWNAFAWYGAVHLFVALVGFTYSAGRLRAVARNAGGAVAPRGRIGKVVSLVTGKRTTARRHPPVSDEPIAWREVYVEPGSGSGVLNRVLKVGVVIIVGWTFLGIVGTTLFGSPYSYYGHYDPVKEFQNGVKAWACGVTGCLGSLMLLSAAVRGASSVAGEKDRDTWTTLLTTPLTADDILWGKWWGCIWGQRHAMYLLAGVWGIGVLTLSVNPLALILVAVAMGVYMTAFAWLGISCSVAARNSRVAIARAVPLGIFLGGGYWIILGCCCALGSVGGGDAFAHLAAFVLGLSPPVVIGVLSAADFEILRDMGRHDIAYIFTGGCGGVVGLVVWYLVAMAYKRRAIELMEIDANRAEGRRQRPTRETESEA